MNNCVFCKIVSQEIPADIVFQDERFLAFLDIHPVSKGHVLLIPKAHAPWMTDVGDAEIGDIFVAAKKIMHAMKRSVGCDYVQLGVVGIEIPHFHIHLIPQKTSDDIPPSFRKSDPYDSDAEKNSFAQQIKDCCSSVFLVQ